MSNNTNSVKESVRIAYAKVATTESGCCGETGSESLGYDRSDLASIPSGADQGLGCGNPLAFSLIQEGDVVLDLGSGGGIDCFLAAAKAGPKGRVIGVDFTPEMIDKARRNAERGGYTNVEFIRGDIESLPLDDNSVDFIISNCVINLTDDKAKVFREMNRVLKPGGSFVISDIVWLSEKPEWVTRELEASGCVSGAIDKAEYISAIQDAGFADHETLKEQALPLDMIQAGAEELSAGCCGSSEGCGGTTDGLNIDELENAIASVTIKGTK